MNGFRLHWSNFAIFDSAGRSLLSFDGGDYAFEGVLALVGPSGSGKTLFARALAVALPPKLKAINPPTLFRGTNGDGYGAIDGDEMAAVPQSPASALPGAVTCSALLDEALSWHPMTTEFRPTSAELLKRVGLSEQTCGPLQASQLSGGMAQRFSLSLALATGASTLILDEPTVGLDAQNVELFVELIKILARDRHLGVIMVTHDHRAAEIADRCVSFTRLGTLVANALVNGDGL